MKCIKIKYTKKEAQEELKRFKRLNRFMPDLRHRAYYYCHNCDKWHLTSQKQKGKQ